jgi:hypothetical protein
MLSIADTYLGLDHIVSLQSRNCWESVLAPKCPIFFRRYATPASNASTVGYLQQTVVKVLSRELIHYSWTGFYMLDPTDSNTLILSPFVGDPTPHVRIPVTQGICGAAVASGETVIVDDVNADPHYLSCSIKTKSEIVTNPRTGWAISLEEANHKPLPGSATQIAATGAEAAADSSDVRPLETYIGYRLSPS